jgi:HEAT repeat protein
LKRVGLEQILEDLKDNDPEIKKLAAKALLKDPSCSDELILSVLVDADKATTTVLYETMFEDERDFPAVFHAAASDPDPLVRRMAIRYLFRRGAFTLEDGVGWLSDSDPYVRRRVISYLFWINDRSALEPVVRISLDDPEQAVRKDALRLVGIWGGRREIPEVIQALEDSSFDVRMQAIRTLKRLTGEDFGEPIGASDDEFEWIIAKWQGWWELMKERI